MAKTQPILVTGQYARIATINFDYKSLPNLTQWVLSLPQDVLILNGALVVTTAFNTGTTDTLALGITGTTGRNLAATTLKTAATTALSATTLVNGDKLLFTRASVGAAATAGAGYLYIQYMGPRIHDFCVGDVLEEYDQVILGQIA